MFEKTEYYDNEADAYRRMRALHLVRFIATVKRTDDCRWKVSLYYNEYAL